MWLLFLIQRTAHTRNLALVAASGYKYGIMSDARFSSKAYQVLVVGAGPCGCAAAFTLTRAGVDVGLLDRAPFPRPKLCGGLLTAKTVQALEHIFQCDVGELAQADVLEARSRTYRILHRKHVLCSGQTRDPFLLARREPLDALLLERAVNAGVSLLQGRVLQCTPARGEVATAEGEVLRAEYLIGADGANSRLRRALKHDKQQWHANLADTVEIRPPRKILPEPLASQDHPSLHLGYTKDGYGWVFPNREHMVLGMCGLRSQTSLIDGFRAMLRSLRLDPDRHAPFRGHPLPYGNWLAAPCRDRLLLAGDAAGFVEPTLGEGIFYALYTGHHAALSVLDQLHGRGKADEQYKRRLERDVLPELRGSLRLRRTLRTAVSLLGYAPMRPLFSVGGHRLGDMVHGRRSYQLLRPKIWQWN